LEAYVEEEKTTDTENLAQSARAEVVSTDVGTDEEGDTKSLKGGDDEHATNEIDNEEAEEERGSESCELSRSIGSFDEHTADNHDYVNTNANVTFSKKSEVSFLKWLKKS
jgi:hypothetical protein